jgi:hypothetical protein
MFGHFLNKIEVFLIDTIDLSFDSTVVHQFRLKVSDVVKELFLIGRD